MNYRKRVFVGLVAPVMSVALVAGIGQVSDASSDTPPTTEDPNDAPPPTEPPVTTPPTEPPATEPPPPETTTTLPPETTVPATVITEPATTTTVVETTLPPDVTTTIETTTTTVTVESSVPESVIDTSPGPASIGEFTIRLSDDGVARAIAFPVHGEVAYANAWDPYVAAPVATAVALQGTAAQPVVAPATGTVIEAGDSSVAVQDDEGWTYRVTGLGAFASGVNVNSRVHARELIGYVGESFAIDFAVVSPDGAPVNPYWSLRAAQRTENCALASLTPGVADTPMSQWLEGTWAGALPQGWSALDVGGAHYWISDRGVTPVNAAALEVGADAYDGTGCVGTTDPSIRLDAASEEDRVLMTIRLVESRDNYGAEAAGSSASGAYQFIDSTWGGYGGYGHAAAAPPSVQDARARQHLRGILSRNGGSVETVPVHWYFGSYPVGDGMDMVPAPEAGNRLTPRQYQRMWVGTYNKVSQRTGATAIELPGAPVDALTCQTRLIVTTTNGTPVIQETVGAAMGFDPASGVITTQPATGCSMPG